MTEQRRVTSGVGVWATGLRFGEPGAVGAGAAALEDLGYASLWIPDVGGDVFGAIELLLDATSTVTVCTGVLNLWMHDPIEVAASFDRVVAAHGPRVLLGIGVSHEQIVDQDSPGRYQRPLLAMREYLDALDAAPTPLRVSDRVLAALGPRMLAMAAERAAGAHPYNATPEHTATVRQVLGADALVLPAQAVLLSQDQDLARSVGRGYLSRYLGMPNYLNNWRRLGFDDADFADGGSDRLVDAIIAWGDEDAILARVRAHYDAGATQVCIQAIPSDGGLLALDQLRALAPALAGI